MAWQESTARTNAAHVYFRWVTLFHAHANRVPAPGRPDTGHGCSASGVQRWQCIAKRVDPWPRVRQRWRCEVGEGDHLDLAIPASEKLFEPDVLVGRALERCIQAGELPEGLFAHFNVPGRLAGGAFLESGIDKLFFTGSVPVGKKLMVKAAETLTPVSLELGGNDAMLVCADADLDRAVGGAVWAGLQNCGQSCGGVERIYVHASIYDAFMEKLKTRVEALRVGPDVDHSCDLGAMTTTRQMVLVREHVADALDRGAAIFAQTSVPEGDTGNFLPAMVLTDVDHSMRVMREETFGPLLGVMKVATMDEAVSLANDSNLGLTASVWGQDRKGAEVLARQLRAGAVTINDHLMSHGLAETPWGGFKESGIGRTHGALGFDEMTQPQCIVHDYLPGVRRNMWWHPFSARVYEGLRGILDLLYGRGVGRRLEGARQLARLFPRTFNLKDDSDDA